MSKRKVELILFDFDGVLSKGRFFATNDHIRTLANEKLFTKEAWPYVKEWMEGKQTYKDVSKKLAEGSGFTPEQIEECLVDSVRSFEMNEQLIEWAKEKKNAGVKIAVFTDNMDIFDEVTVKFHKFDGIFDRIFSSSKFGKLKLDNDGEFLNYAIKEMKSKPENTLFIDDSPKISPAMEKINGLAYVYEDYANQYEKLAKWWVENIN